MAIEQKKGEPKPGTFPYNTNKRELKSSMNGKGHKEKVRSICENTYKLEAAHHKALDVVREEMRLRGVETTRPKPFRNDRYVIGRTPEDIKFPVRK